MSFGVSYHQLKQFIDQFKNQKVLIVGDVMLDEHFWCEVNRISPEAPVPVCKIGRITRVPGGAGNVAMNVRSLGAETTLVGVIGQDSSAQRLTEALDNAQIVSDGLVSDPKRATILKTRVIAHQQQVVRIDREDGHRLSPIIKKSLFKMIQAKIPECSVVILSDYLKGTLSEFLTTQIIQLAHQHHKPVIVDPKGESFLKYRGASIITPNFKEFLTAIKKSSVTEKLLFQNAQKLIKKLKVKGLLVTRSEQGMTWIGEQKRIDIPTQAQEVFDITGAGDTAIAVLGLGVSVGMPYEEAAILSNLAAGIVVAKLGTAFTRKEEIQSAIYTQFPQGETL